MKRVERNINLIKWIYLTQGLIFVGPVLVLYFQERGLVLSQILMLQFVFSASSLVLEFPSGYVSDKLGRKRTLVIAYGSLVLAVWLFLNGKSFESFAFAELCFAMGYSLTSGTLESVLFESLKVLDRVDENDRIYGDIKHKMFLTIAFAGVVGGLIAKYISLTATVAVTLAAYIGSFILALLIKEPNAANKRAFKEDIKDFRLVLSNKELITITVFVALIFAFNQVSFWYYQPYFKAVNVDLAYFGVLFASFQVVASFGSKYADAIMRRFSKEQIFAAIALMIPVSLLGMGWFFSYAGILFVYLQQIVRGGFDILANKYAQKYANSELRATTISFMKLAQKLFYAANLYLFVQISKGVDLQHTYFIMASVLAGLLGLFFIVARFLHK